VEAICKKYIELRYQLLPYLYLLFVEASRSGAPIMRPLLWHYQDDSTAAAVDDQFMLGADLLVAPILRQGATARSVYLPRGEWFNFWTGERHSGQQHVLANAELEFIPLYARAGSIIPMTAVQQYVEKHAPSTVNLHIWTGSEGRLRWYEDDGRSFAHLRGGIHERHIKFVPTARDCTLHFLEPSSSYPSAVNLWRIILRGAQNPSRVTVNGRPVRGRFDPGLRLYSCEIPNTTAAILVKFH
jgi:alpha-glucosidase